MCAQPDPVDETRLTQIQQVLIRQAGPAFGLRPELPEDGDFSQRLYGVTRKAELARVNWPAAAKQAFIEQQFQAQYQHYRQHYPQALFLLVCHQDQPVGRLYLSPGKTELRLMDIILMPELRGQGLGRALLAAVLDWAISDGLDLSLHVEADNPARLWYQRLGFDEVELRGVYVFMRLVADAQAEAQLKLIS
jgi:GNAT superfamily N-acetyltransferase